MKLKHSVLNGLTTLLSVLALFLMSIQTAFADIVSVFRPEYLQYCSANPGIECVSGEILWFTLFFYILGYIFWTLVFEAPVFRIFGFKTKGQIRHVVVANAISVSLYHTTNAVLGGTLGWEYFDGGLTSGILVAELFIVVFECVFLAFLLKKELSIKRIVVATIVANIVSVALGYILIAAPVIAFGTNFDAVMQFIPVFGVLVPEFLVAFLLLRWLFRLFRRLFLK